jgi:hypothetical protein
MLLEQLRGKASERKLRLFACACCRDVLHLSQDDLVGQVISTSERYGDGLASRTELISARRRALRALSSLSASLEGAYATSRDEAEMMWAKVRVVEAAKDSTYVDSWQAAYSACICAAHAVGTDAARVAASPTYEIDQYVPAEEGGREKEYRRLSDTLRDIFGPLPFHTVTIDPAWLRWNHGTVPTLARRIYEDRAFHDLPILADALEDAGCTDAAILDHCRQPGGHARGCWVVDLILGQS